MIHWLIQSTVAHPDLAHGYAPPGLLSATEESTLSGFSVLKRRQDWLLGRWTMKLLLQEMIHQNKGRGIALQSMSVLAGKEGAPRVSFAAPHNDLDSAFSISISHSHGTSLCAAVAQHDWPLGADIEWIEPRSANFPADFFTIEEQAQIKESLPGRREELVTAVWSGKEAALKAIRAGLRSDTRSVSCHFKTETTTSCADSLKRAARANGSSDHPANWQPFRIRWEREEDRKQHPALKGWWMVSGPFILTLAAGNPNKGKHLTVAHEE